MSSFSYCVVLFLLCRPFPIVSSFSYCVVLFLLCRPFPIASSFSYCVVPFLFVSILSSINPVPNVSTQNFPTLSFLFVIWLTFIDRLLLLLEKFKSLMSESWGGISGGSGFEELGNNRLRSLAHIAVEALPIFHLSYSPGKCLCLLRALPINL